MAEVAKNEPEEYILRVPYGLNILLLEPPVDVDFDQVQRVRESLQEWTDMAMVSRMKGKEMIALILPTGWGARWLLGEPPESGNVNT